MYFEELKYIKVYLKYAPGRGKKTVKKGHESLVVCCYYVAEVVHFSKEKHQFMWSSCGQPFCCRLLQRQACTGMASQNDRIYGCL